MLLPSSLLSSPSLPSSLPFPFIFSFLAPPHIHMLTHTTHNVESVTEYFLIVLAGLAGSCHMISATILALSRLVYEFYGGCMMALECTSLSIVTCCQGNGGCVVVVICLLLVAVSISSTANKVLVLAGDFKYHYSSSKLN